jgi:hypothetical protein
MVRRLVRVLWIASALLALLAGSAAAEAPPGPRLTFESSGEGGYESISTDRR